MGKREQKLYSTIFDLRKLISKFMCCFSHHFPKLSLIWCISHNTLTTFMHTLLYYYLSNNNYYYYYYYYYYCCCCCCC